MVLKPRESNEGPRKASEGVPRSSKGVQVFDINPKGLQWLPSAPKRCQSFPVFPESLDPRSVDLPRVLEGLANAKDEAWKGGSKTLRKRTKGVTHIRESRGIPPKAIEAVGQLRGPAWAPHWWTCLESWKELQSPRMELRGAGGRCTKGLHAFGKAREAHRKHCKP